MQHLSSNFKALLTCLVMLFACTGSPNEGGFIDATYDKPFPKRSKNLKWKLGNEFYLKNGNDTLHIQVKFDRSNRTNTLSEVKSGDTLFHGKVSKYKGLYFLSQLENNGRYSIQAIEINKGLFAPYHTIKGLGSHWLQMLALADTILEYSTNTDYYSWNSDSSELLVKVDKQRVFQMHSHFLKDLEPDTLIYSLDNETGKSGQQSTELDTSNWGSANSKADASWQIYPNPFTDLLNVKIPESEVRIEIYDLKGNLLISKESISKTLSLNTQRLRVGKYVAIIQNSLGESHSFQVIKTIN